MEIMGEVVSCIWHLLETPHCSNTQMPSFKVKANYPNFIKLFLHRSITDLDNMMCDSNS